MRYGVHVQNSDRFGDPRILVEMAQDAESAGWDGFFLWDHLVYSKNPVVPVTDPWVTLAAIAATTRHISLGTMVTPLARRRPWIVARETVALDVLSEGRLILGVGLGDPVALEFSAFGEDGDTRLRAAKLDEALEIVTGLWTGQPFRYDGTHYTVNETTFLPQPVQTPRIPIWVAGEWPNKPPFRRAARWDGMFPSVRGLSVDEMMSPHDLRQIVQFTREQRKPDEPFDVALGGYTPAGDHENAVAIVDAYVDAGMTWWLEGLNVVRSSFEDCRTRIRVGPPKR